MGGAINAFVQGGNAFGAAATVGTTDAFPLTVKSGGTAVSVLTGRGDGLRIVEAVVGSVFFAPNKINGDRLHSVAVSVIGATITGGGQEGGGADPVPNVVNQNYGTIGGGVKNTVGGFLLPSEAERVTLPAVTTVSQQAPMPKPPARGRLYGLTINLLTIAALQSTATTFAPRVASTSISEPS